MTALESDLKRMVQNAKEFNVTGSKVYEDAERIRKALSNFMPKHNPAYKDEGYRAVPTPVPEDNEGNDDASAQHTTPAPHTIKLIVNGTGGGTTGGTRTKGDTPIAGDEDIRDQQLKIVQEMIELRDPEFVIRGMCSSAVAYMVQ